MSRIGDSKPKKGGGHERKERLPPGNDVIWSSLTLNGMEVSSKTFPGLPASDEHGHSHSPMRDP